MQNKILRLGFAFLLLFFMSCDKYDTMIEGKVTYIDTVGNSNAAVGALVEKLKIVDNDTIKMVAVLTDTIGNYRLEYVTKGNWLLKSTMIVDDTIKYEGYSNIIKSTGQDGVLLEDIVLYYLQN